MADKQTQENRPKVQYRVELEKKIEINKSYSERRNQAIAMRILSYGLFGQKRYQNLYLSCSLNCFYYGLKIANAIHRRVPGLAMIIKFEQAHVIEYYSQPFEGKTYGEKKYSKINIKLTKTPTKEDMQEPGYNPGLSVEDIEQPLTDVIARKERPEGDRRRGKFIRRYNNRDGQRPFRGGFRRPFGGYRDERQDRERRDPRVFRERREPGEFRQGREPRQRREPRQGREPRQEREPRQVREPREGGVDYRQFRSNRYEDEGNVRGERKTRGTYQKGPSNGRFERPGYEQDRTFERRRFNEREDRGPRRPQRGKYEGDSDQQ